MAEAHQNCPAAMDGVTTSGSWQHHERDFRFRRLRRVNVSVLIALAICHESVTEASCPFVLFAAAPESACAAVSAHGAGVACTILTRKVPTQSIPNNKWLIVQVFPSSILDERTEAV